MGWFRVSFEKYVETHLWTSEILRYKIKDFWKFLGEWFCAGNQLAKVTNFVYQRAWEVATEDVWIRIKIAKMGGCHVLKHPRDMEAWWPKMKIRALVATVKTVVHFIPFCHAQSIHSFISMLLVGSLNKDVKFCIAELKVKLYLQCF